jgi:DNA-binding MarR family transcriptional regulator
VTASRLQHEIKQTKPFRSLEAEAYLSILRTADGLKRAAAPLFEAAGLTEQQYNVLRILRGAGADGLPTLAIAERLIEHTPGITRLLDRIEAKGLVRRERPEADRRQVYCFPTAAGLALLAELDPVVDRQSSEAFAGLSKSGLRALVETLAEIRNRN